MLIIDARALKLKVLEDKIEEWLVANDYRSRSGRCWRRLFIKVILASVNAPFPIGASFTAKSYHRIICFCIHHTYVYRNFRQMLNGWVILIRHQKQLRNTPNFVRSRPQILNSPLLFSHLPVKQHEAHALMQHRVWFFPTLFTSITLCHAIRM